LSLNVWTDDHGHFSTFYTLVETPDYRLDIEETPLSDSERVYSIHFEIVTWTPSVLKEMLRDWPHVRAKIDAPILACAENQDPKWEKFIQKFGFSYLMDVEGVDGTSKRMFVNVK
jgi:hypothetical protein